MQVTTATGDALQRYLDLASDQMKLTAENMANVDTPGYRYIGFDQTRTENNGLTLTTANGAPLVSEGQSYPLGTAAVNGNTNVISALGQDITSALTGGSIGGMLQARDHDLPSASSGLDSLAYGIASAVNTQNQAGLDATGNPGGPIFNLPATAAGTASTISPRHLRSQRDCRCLPRPKEPLAAKTAAAPGSLANATLVNSQTAVAGSSTHPFSPSSAARSREYPTKTPRNRPRSHNSRRSRVPSPASRSIRKPPASRNTSDRTTPPRESSPSSISSWHPRSTSAKKSPSPRPICAHQ